METESGRVAGYQTGGMKDHDAHSSTFPFFEPSVIHAIRERFVLIPNIHRNNAPPDRFLSDLISGFYNAP
jgi:hypothetical protein